MSSAPERFPLRRSIALRLGLWHALFFAAGTAAMFAVVYLSLAQALEERDREALDVRAAIYANAYEQAGYQGLQIASRRDQELVAVQSLFVAFADREGTFSYLKVPPNWIEEDVEMVPNVWGTLTPQRVQSIRIPQDAQRDIVVVSREVTNGTVVVARSTDNRATLLAPLRRVMGYAGTVAVLLSAGAGVWLSWRSTLPVREVAATARKIVQTGDLTQRVPDQRASGEVAELVRQFNTLLERNNSLLGAMRESLDNVAHDLRTPLTRLRAGAEAALGDAKTPAVRESLVDCIEETDRIRRLLDLLLDVSAAESGVLPIHRETVDVEAALRKISDLYSLVAEEKNLELNCAVTPGLTVSADPARLRQILANLTDNALKYTPEGGRVELRAERSGNQVMFTVRDSGPGVPEAEQEKIWRRLYRTDQSRSQHGLGLGLSIVKVMTEAHGGTVGVHNHPEGGAVFEVRLPA